MRVLARPFLSLSSPVIQGSKASKTCALGMMQMVSLAANSIQCISTAREAGFRLLESVNLQFLHPQEGNLANVS